MIAQERNATSIATIFHLIIVFARPAFSESPAEKI